MIRIAFAVVFLAIAVAHAPLGIGQIAVVSALGPFGPSGWLAGILLAVLDLTFGALAAMERWPILSLLVTTALLYTLVEDLVHLRRRRG